MKILKRIYVYNFWVKRVKFLFGLFIVIVIAKFAFIVKQKYFVYYLWWLNIPSLVLFIIFYRQIKAEQEKLEFETVIFINFIHKNLFIFYRWKKFWWWRFRLWIRTWNPIEKKTKAKSDNIYSTSIGWIGESIWTNSISRYLYKRRTCTKD